MPVQTALTVTGLTKTFGGTKALDDVSFDVRTGTIHALLGGNGSGKSTTIKILAGIYNADAGQVSIRNTEIDARSCTPAQSWDAGLRFVHQQQSTFPDLSVAENLAIGHGFDVRFGWKIPWREQRRHAAEVLDRFNIAVRPDAPLASLSPATRTMVSIARALQDQDASTGGLLVLDEPTASLPLAEVEFLLTALKGYAAAGQTILYVTHRLEEVIDAADRATVLRDGRFAASLEESQITHEHLIEAIVGRSIDRLSARPASKTAGRVRLTLSNVSAGGIDGISTELRAGEIVGVAGLLGSGRSTLLRAIFGAVPLSGGEMTLDDQAFAPSEPRRSMERGVAYIPEDRAVDAAFPALTVRENIGVASGTQYFKRGRTRHRAEDRDIQADMQAYRIKAESSSAPLLSLSGGNQQKVILARWLRRNPGVLLLDEPTQGVDVGARLEIWEIVRRAVDAGAAALVVSSDFEELSRVCDRALVLRRGRLVGELDQINMSEANLDMTTLGSTTDSAVSA